MRWRYYIPHTWEAERTGWEDIWLLPAVRDPQADSIWLTVDGCEDIDADVREKLGDRAYVIEGADMYVNVPEFSKPELVGYAKIWLEHQGFEQVQLSEGERAEFDGTNQHARMISTAVDAREAYERARDEDDDEVAG